MNETHENPTFLKPQSSASVKLLLFAASFPMLCTRNFVGLGIIPIWHLLVLIGVSGVLAFITLNPLFFLIAGLSFSYGLGHFLQNSKRISKEKTADKFSLGVSRFGGFFPQNWQAETVRMWADPLVFFLMFAPIFWIARSLPLGIMMIVGAILLHVVERVFQCNRATRSNPLVNQNHQQSRNTSMKSTKLTQTRIIAAFAVGVLIDLIQLPINALMLSGVFAVPAEIADVIVDGIAMAAISGLIGFHWILLPSAFVEIVPGLALFPTWTGSVAFLVWKQKKRGAALPVDVSVETSPTLARQDSASRRIEERLRDLEAMWRRNILTQTEYEQKRGQLLGEL